MIMHICICIYIYIWINVCKHVYVYMHTFIYMCVYKYYYELSPVHTASDTAGLSKTAEESASDSGCAGGGRVKG